jgi:hypothetical protein
MKLTNSLLTTRPQIRNSEVIPLLSPKEIPFSRDSKIRTRTSTKICMRNTKTRSKKKFNGLTMSNTVKT